MVPYIPGPSLSYYGYYFCNTHMHTPQHMHVWTLWGECGVVRLDSQTNIHRH